MNRFGRLSAVQSREKWSEDERLVKFHSVEVFSQQGNLFQFTVFQFTIETK